MRKTLLLSLVTLVLTVLSIGLVAAQPLINVQYEWVSYPTSVQLGQTLTIKTKLTNTANEPFVSDHCFVGGGVERDIHAELGPAIDFTDTQATVTLPNGTVASENKTYRGHTQGSLSAGFSTVFSIPVGQSATIATTLKLSSVPIVGDKINPLVVYCSHKTNKWITARTPNVVVAVVAAPGASKPTGSTSKPTTTTTPAATPVGKPAAPVLADDMKDQSAQGMTVKAGDPLILSGQTVPNGQVTLYVYSEPKMYKAMADASGKWTYTVTSLPAGQHHVEAEVTDPVTKQTSDRAQLLEFTVLAAATKPDTKSQAGKTGVSRLLFWIGLGVLGVGAGVAVWWMRRRQKTSGQSVIPVYGSSNMTHPVVGTFQGKADNTYVLSGFLDEQSYKARTPGWNDDKQYDGYNEALASAKKWQSDNGVTSTVEVIEMDGSNGTVKAVVDRNGVELIS